LASAEIAEWRRRRMTIIIGDLTVPEEENDEIDT